MCSINDALKFLEYSNDNEYGEFSNIYPYYSLYKKKITSRKYFFLDMNFVKKLYVFGTMS